MAKLLDEIHPGEILLEEFLKPLGITARQLAADIDVSKPYQRHRSWSPANYCRHGFATRALLRHGGHGALLLDQSQDCFHPGPLIYTCSCIILI